MPLSINDPETERLAHALAERTGETVQEALKQALENRLEQIEAANLVSKRPSNIGFDDEISR